MRRAFPILVCWALAGLAGTIDFAGPLLKPYEWTEPIGWLMPGPADPVFPMPEKPEEPQSWILLEPPPLFYGLEPPQVDSNAVPEPSAWVFVAIGVGALAIAAATGRLRVAWRRKIRYEG